MTIKQTGASSDMEVLDKLTTDISILDRKLLSRHLQVHVKEKLKSQVDSHIDRPKQHRGKPSKSIIGCLGH